MTVKDYLNQYRTVCLEVSRLQRRLEVEEARAERTTKALTLTPRGGEFRTDDVWAELADLREKYRATLAGSLALQKEIEQFVDSVPSDMSRLILRFRYIDLLRWEEIAKAVHYGWAQVHRLHAAALAEAESVWEEWKAQRG